MPDSRVQLLDMARGLAALAVTWEHIVLKNPMVMTNPAYDAFLQESARYGYLGVYAFFMVSGFVIPLALLRGEYRLAMFWRFMAKRLVRLQPPFYASILLAVAVAAAATIVPSYVGIPFRVDPVALSLHLIYMPTVFGYAWINPVYWTLLVEVEFYIVIGLAMPWLMRLSQNGLAVTLCGACLVPFAIPSFDHFPLHVPYFVIGVALCFRVCGRLSDLRTAAVIAVVLVATWFQRDPPGVAVAVLVIPLFLLPVAPPRFLRRLGDISYSLYLVHYIVGWRGLRAFLRFAHTDAERLCAYGAAVALSLAVATALYWLVERPSLRWSARIKLTGRRQAFPDLAATVPAP